MAAAEDKPTRQTVAVGRRFPTRGVMDAQVSPDLPRTRPTQRPKR